MDTLSILLVEDDTEICNEFVRCANTLDDVIIQNITNSATEALNIIIDTIPDVIILDLELHFGSGCGLDVLQGMHEHNMAHTPYILITTNNSSTVTLEFARELGADLIMSKHQKDYSPSYVLNLLRAMKTPIIQKRNSVFSTKATPETPELQRKNLTQHIICELNLVGISPKMLGYNYLTDAILLILNNQTQHIYQTLAQQYKKTSGSIERAMQNAIYKAWTSDTTGEYTKHYTSIVNPNKGAPTITEFIYYYANKIKNFY